MKKRLRFSLVLMMWIMLSPPLWFVTVSSAVILHEAAHLAACRIMGIKVLSIKALPWGLTASTPLMYDPGTQLVISLAGPMCNFFLLLFCPVIKTCISREGADLFALANIADGLFNLIPALPLDGGIMLKAFLCAKLGIVRGFSYMLKITVFFGAMLMLLGVYIFCATLSNASYLVAGGFILYNLRHERELSLCIKKRVLTGEISSRPCIKNIYADTSSNAICLIDRISPTHTIKVHITKQHETIGTLSQKRLVACVLKNSMITLGECIEKD